MTTQYIVGEVYGVRIVLIGSDNPKSDSRAFERIKEEFRECTKGKFIEYAGE